MSTRIGLVGGMARQQRELTRLAEAAGHSLRFHPGQMRGRGPTELRTLVANSDVVVIVTDMNSHAAAQVAKRLVRHFQRRSIMLSRCGLARFQALLDALTVHERRALTAPGPAEERHHVG